MKHIALHLCAALLIVGTQPVIAQGSYLILSAGNYSCGTFVRGDETTKELYLGWAVGFISGANSRATGADRMVGETWDRDSALVWLGNYCTKDPLVRFHLAAESYRAALAAKQSAR